MNTAIEHPKSKVPAPRPAHRVRPAALPGVPAGPAGAPPDEEGVLGALTEKLFVSLARSDQRRKGSDYLRGLLSTPGRKSIRNMASLIGDSATGQGLHHFICNSTWDWTPVRRALAAHLLRTAPPVAWVVRPLTIPKVGRHSVGVGRYFSSAEGQMITAQRAIGVWMASDRVSVPVEWRLHLSEPPRSALDCGGVRVPARPDPGLLAEHAAQACLAVASWGAPVRPAVLDLDGADPLPALERLRAAGLRAVARVPEDVELRVEEPALTGHHGRTLPAGSIMRASRELRRPVIRGTGGGPRPVRRPPLMATVRVGRPVPGAADPAGTAPGGGLTLVGLGPGGPDWPGELWLTTYPADRAAMAIPRSADLVDRVGRSLASVGDRVGVRDYAGRSFNGWHRHITLASAAYAVAELAGSAGAPHRP